MEPKVALEELLQSTRGLELEGPVGVTKWPEIGALSVPLRFL